MTVRPVTPADDVGIALAWNEAVPHMGFMPNIGLVSNVQARQGWIEPLKDRGDLYVLEELGAIQGWFLTWRNAAVELPDGERLGPAERLVLWILRPGLTAAQKHQALNDLFIYWFKQAIKRGAVWMWGAVPAGESLLALKFLRGWGLKEAKYEGDPVLSAVFWDEAEAGLKRLPVLTTVTP